MIIMAVALIALPTMAQEWESTSSMQSSGSTYSPQVTAVGATAVPSEATTTTANYAPGRPGQPRRSLEDNTELGPGNPGSPIGDAVLPLMLMAMAFCGAIAIRKKRSALNR